MKNPSSQSPLKVESYRLVKGPVEFDFEVEPSVFDIEEDPDYQFNHPITGRIKANSAGGDTVLVTASLKTKVSTICSRCLDHIELPIEVWTQQAWFVEEKKPSRDKANDEDRLLFDGNVLDPTEALREEIMVALPPLPRCTPEINAECAADKGEQKWTFGDDKVRPEANETTKSWIEQLNEAKSKIADKKSSS